MKRLFRHACAMLAVFLVMSLFTVVNASAANGTTIDTTNAKYGFVTVNYTSNAKLKVGIQYGSEKVSYKNCPSGKDAVFSLEQGDGTYTIRVPECKYNVVGRCLVHVYNHGIHGQLLDGLTFQNTHVVGHTDTVASDSSTCVSAGQVKYV